MHIINNNYKESVEKIFKKIDTPDRLRASSPSKISKKTNSAFSLPAGPAFSCPGATKACEGCYAMKGRHRFSNVQMAFAKNLKLLLHYENTNNTDTAVEAILEIMPAKNKIFRIHESGDFFSQWYLNVWAKVVKQRPNVHFWAYTRSFNLNFNKLLKLKNFTLWASTDPYNLKTATKFVNKYKKYNVKHAYGPWKKDQELPAKSFVCPVTNGKLKTEGACEKCELCVVKDRVNKNVVFIEH